MALNPRLELRTQQKLALTPEVRTRLSILRMAPAELDDEIAREAAENPFLTHERRQSSIAGSQALVEDLLTARDAPFQEDLRSQIRQMGLSRGIEALALLLIAELRADGFLDVELHELSDEHGIALDLFEQALDALQRCEPTGIAARSLHECLYLQLCEHGLPPDEAEETLSLLPAFARQDWKQIGEALGLDAAGVQARAVMLRGLSPRPLGNRETDEATPLIADLRLERSESGGEARVVPVDSAQPRVKLDLAMAKKAAQDGFAPELLSRAQALLAALEQRGRTLARIGDWLAEKQAGFFRLGPAGLVPATRVELAGELGLHPSTISRALTGKAIDIDGRLWPLGVFFSSALNGKDGAVSSRAVQRQLAELIAAEPAGRPLSDAVLTGLLRSQGVDIARRTVAKYRQGLRIPSSSARRRLAAARRGE